MNIVGIVFIVIFVGVIGFMIWIAFFGSKKEKRNKRRIQQKKKKRIEEASGGRIQIIAFLYFMTSWVNDNKEKIESGEIGVPFQTTNEISKRILKQLRNSNEYSLLMKVDEIKEEIQPIYNDLNNNQARYWYRDVWMNIGILNKKFELINKNDDYKEIVEKARKVWETIKNNEKEKIRKGKYQ